MKHRPLPLALLLTALAAPLLSPSARAEVEVSFSFFQESLAPYGEWIEVGSYGNCWRPTGVSNDWAPYTDGYWAYTDAGWTWVSYEDWGDITYHYGRWTNVSDEGWCWVPDQEWAPAWVSWRSNDDYVGWAPLPPEVRWQPSIGVSAWVDHSYDIGPEYYNFCHTRDFSAPYLAGVCLPRERNVTFIENTVNITNITYNTRNKVIYNGGPNYANINRRVNRNIPALKLVHDQRVDGQGRRGWRSRQQGNQLAVYSPRVVRDKDGEGPRIKPVRTVPADRVGRGWSKVQDPAVKQRLRDKIREENKGRTPDTAPARPVQAKDLAVVPKKANPDAPSPVAVRNGRGQKQPGKNAANNQRPDRPERPDRVDPNQPATIAGDNRPDGRPDKDRPDSEKKTEVTTPPATAQQPVENAEPRPDRPGKADREKDDKPAVANRPDGSDRPDAGEGRRRGNENAASASQGGGQPEKPDRSNPGQDDAARTAQQELRREQAQQQQKAAQAAEARRDRLQEAARNQQQENAAQEARRQRQQAASVREQQPDNAARAEARRQQQQAENARRQGDGAREAAAAQRAQQQRQEAAGEARRQQMQQAEGTRRQQQAMEMQRAAQQQRQAQAQAQRRVEQPTQRAPQQIQRPPQQAQRPQPQASGGNQGGREGRGKQAEEKRKNGQ